VPSVIGENMTNEQKKIIKSRLVMSGIQALMGGFSKLTDDVILLQTVLDSIQDKSDVDKDVEDLTIEMEKALDTVHVKIQDIAKKIADEQGFSLEEIKATIQEMIKGPKNQDSGDNIVDQFR